MKETLTTRYDPYDDRYEHQLMIVLGEQERLSFTHTLFWFDAARETW